MPCFANSPSPTVIWQRPQIARPPQTESMSTPSDRAACSTGVPIGKRPRRPEGVNTISASSLSVIPLSAAAASFLALPASRIDIIARSRRASIAGLRRRWGRFAELANPGEAVGIDAVQHIGAHDRVHVFIMQRIHDRARHPVRGGHRQEIAGKRPSLRHAEGDVARPAGGIDLELLPEAAYQPEHLLP